MKQANFADTFPEHPGHPSSPTFVPPKRGLLYHRDYRKQDKMYRHGVLLRTGQKGLVRILYVFIPFCSEKTTPNKKLLSEQNFRFFSWYL